MRNRRRIWPFLILLGDAVFIPCSFIAGHYLRFGNFNELAVKVPFTSLFWMTLGYLAAFYFFDIFSLEEDYASINSFIKLFAGVFISSVFVSFINYGLFLEPIGRGIFILSNIVLFILIFLWKVVCGTLSRHFSRPTRVLIIGAGKAGQEIAKIIRAAQHDYSIIGFLDDNANMKGKPVSGTGVVVKDSTDRLLDVCGKEKVDQIVLAVSTEGNPTLSELLLKARLNSLEVIEMPDLYQQIKGRIPINHIPETWFLKARGFDWSDKSVMIRVKRLMDIVISSLLLVLSLPLWILIALLIKVTSRGPVFYVQDRVGKNDGVFSLVKFRSMVHGAEVEQPLWAVANDRRVTFVGKILRKFHLDELPQLLNVLKGEMSLVGPRPERPMFVAEFKEKIPYYSLRHFLKPGLTGWAQVSFPYAASLKDAMEKLEYDLYYIYHMNFLLDLRILLKTFQNILLRKKKEKK